MLRPSRELWDLTIFIARYGKKTREGLKNMILRIMSGKDKYGKWGW